MSNAKIWWALKYLFTSDYPAELYQEDESTVAFIFSYEMVLISYSDNK